MIIARQDDQLQVTTQTDHAAFSAELLSLWRIDGVPDHARRQDLLFAAREHDNGWQETDSAPSRRADGTPHDFLSISGEQRREIWRRGVSRHGIERPWAALLILEHALNLHRSQAKKESWRELIASWHQLRTELLDGSHEEAMQEEQLTADYRLIDAVDTLSLALCAGWSEEGEHAGVRYLGRLEPDRAELRLEPFPLAGSTTFTLHRRAIKDRVYSSDVELAMELATARWQRLPVRVLPFDKGRS